MEKKKDKVWNSNNQVMIIFAKSSCHFPQALLRMQLLIKINLEEACSKKLSQDDGKVLESPTSLQLSKIRKKVQKFPR